MVSLSAFRHLFTSGIEVSKLKRACLRGPDGTSALGHTPNNPFTRGRHLTNPARSTALLAPALIGSQISQQVPMVAHHLQQQGWVYVSLGFVPGPTSGHSWFPTCSHSHSQNCKLKRGVQNQYPNQDQNQYQNQYFHHILEGHGTSKSTENTKTKSIENIDFDIDVQGKSISIFFHRKLFFWNQYRMLRGFYWFHH